MGLGPKQRAFVEFYLISWNAREAAEKAGYKSPQKAGWRLLQYPDIAELVNQRIKEIGASADEVLIRLTKQARSNLGDFLTYDPKTKKAEVNWERVVQDSGDVIKKISYTRHGTPVLELYDKQRALELLGRFLKMENAPASENQDKVEDLSALVDLINNAKDARSDTEEE